MIPGTSRPERETRDSAIPSVLAIVVTHNGRAWLRDCLVSLNAQTYPLLDVLVVDDASSDSKKQPTLKRVTKRHLRKRRWGYLRTPRALGFGGAINWALSRVRTDADLLLFIHDDAALDDRAVEKMTVRLLDDDHTAVVGPKIVSWDDPQRLEEVGMAADRFGYPYKGLEEGEIDLGQHDDAAEVFYVTSTCMLVRHDVFKQLRGWDARMRAFAEDLDLCWRARLAGYTVRIEPHAKARHAIAMATGERPSPFSPARYFIRRNRLRTVFKNVSTLRLIALVPQFVLLTFAEMLGFIVLREPGEIWNLTRALGWNFISLPQTLSERTRIQRRRKISDLKLRRLTVRQSTRVRSYVNHQRDRLEETWGRRAELVARRGSQARLAGTQLKGWVGVVVFVAVLALLLGFRHIWWSPPIAVGEILPYPDRATALWRAFFAPWRAVGLGQADPNPGALGLLGFFPMITFGAAGAAQKLLILSLGLAAFTGAYLLVSDLVDRPASIAAGTSYMLGAVGYAGIRQGALGALVFGAAAPFVLHSLVRLAGWVRPPAWSLGRTIARVAFGSAVSAAFVPGSLLLYLLAAVVIIAARALFGGRKRALRSFSSAAAGLLLGWAMLLPWSSSWFGDQGPLAVLRGESWATYARSFRGHDMVSVVLGQTPEGPVLFGLAMPLLGLVALVAAEGQRRRMAFVLWGIVVTVGLFVTLTATGTIRPWVASPAEAGVLGWAAFAGLVGLAVGAFRLDLPRRGFGWIHWATLGGFAAAIFLIASGLGPALLSGEWSAGRGSGRENADVVAQVSSVLRAEAAEIGPFRTLWVGEGWTAPEPVLGRPFGRTFVTGPRSQVLSDLFERRSEASDLLDEVVASVDRGGTDRGGALLGAFNIHLVVLERTSGAHRWLAQRDLAILREAEEYVLLTNEDYLPRAAGYDEGPVLIEALDTRDPSLSAGLDQPPTITLDQKVPYGYTADGVSGPGTVLLAEAEHPGWNASFDGEELERTEGGWGNAFALPAGEGDLEVSVDRSLGQILWSIIIFAAWLVVIGASFSKRREPKVGRSVAP